MADKKYTFEQLEEFISLLKTLQKRIVFKQVMTGLFPGISFFLVFLSALLLIERFFYLPPSVKSIFWVIIIALSVFIVAYSLKKRTRQTFPTFYEEVLQATGQQKLLNALDLYLTKSEKNAFTYAAVQRNLDESDLPKAENSVRACLSAQKSSVQFKRNAILFVGIFVLFGTLCLLYPADTKRAFAFWKEYTQPNPFVFDIAPGDTTTVHGAAIQIEAIFTGAAVPKNVVLHFKTGVETDFRARNTTKINSHTFTSRELELASSLQYYMEMDGFASDTFHVNVQQQPGFEKLITTIIPPAYTNLPELGIQYPSTEVSFYPGSQLHIQATPNKTVDSVTARLPEHGEQLPLQPSDEHIFSLNVSPAKSDTITFSMIDREGLKNQNHYRTLLIQKEDMPPVVMISEPAENIQANNLEFVDFVYEVIDDFGLSRAELQWELRRAFTDSPQTGSINLGTPRNGPAERFRWDITEFDLRPRDVLTVWIKAWDNDEISGYKPGQSGEIIIQIPSLADFFDEIDNQEQNVGDNLDHISQQFEAMEQEYQQFLERLRQNPEGGFEESQMLQDVRERQQEMEQTVEALQEHFRELRSEIENSRQISDETRRSYRELQQLMDELDDPDLLRALEELQRAMESLSPEQLQQAMENVAFNEQLYKERIERTIELFKQLQMNSNLDKLARHYEDMAQRVNPEQPAEHETFGNELNSVSEDLDATEQQIDNLGKNPPQRAAEQLQQLKEQAKENLSSIREQLQHLQQQHAGEEKNDAGQQQNQQNTRQMQQQLSEQMQQEAEHFRAAISEMEGQQIQVNILALQRALYTLLELSDQQELLTLNTTATRSQSQGFVELARLQNNIGRQFSLVSDTLFQVSAEIPGLSNQINRKKLDIERTLKNAVNEMTERNQRGATVTTRESLGGINDLSSMIASLLEQLISQQNSGAGGGMSMQQMIDQMQNMSGNQQQLNQQLQEMVNDMQGDRLSREQSDRLDQLARQQNEIRRQLQELQQRGSLDQGDRTLSELQRMIEDMEESINDMRGGVTDPLMIQRQQNILSRMLSAEESLQQRGETEEREGDTPLDYERSLPPEFTLDDLEQQIRARLQDPNYSSFSEEYRRIIERYFEELKKRDSSILQ